MPSASSRQSGNDMWSHNGLLYAALAGLVVLSALPLPFGPGPWPDLVLIVLYVVFARWPDKVPVGLAFALGLLSDCVGSDPFGTHALVYVLMHGLVVRILQPGRSFVLLWLAFIPAAAFAGLIAWGGAMLVHSVWIGFDPVLTRSMVSVLLFPLIAAPVLWLGHEAGDAP